MIDHFAERLSQHGDVAKAAAQLGRSEAWGKTQFAAIRKRLGEQARFVATIAVRGWAA